MHRYINKTNCCSDAFTTRLLMSHLHTITPILEHYVNPCLTTADFPNHCKSSIIIHLIKKPCLNDEALKSIDLYEIFFFPMLLKKSYLLVFRTHFI